MERKKIDMYKLSNYVSKLNYIQYIFFTTICFWMSNLPLLLCLLVLPFTSRNIFYVILSCFLLGPSFHALLMTLHQVEETHKIFSVYFKKLKKSLKIFFKVWILVFACISVAVINITYLISELFGNGILIIKIINWFILLYIFAFIVNFYLLNTYFENIPIKNGVIVTFQLSMIKSGRFSLGILLILGMLVLFSNLGIYLLLFGVGIIGGLLLINFKPISEFIRKNLEGKHKWKNIK